MTACPLNTRKPWRNGRGSPARAIPFPWKSSCVRSTGTSRMSTPSIRTFLNAWPNCKRAAPRPRRVLEPGLYLEGDRLYVESARVLIDHPTILMKLFWQAVKENVSLSQETIRLIKQCLFLVDESFQRSPEVAQFFVDLVSDLKTSRSLLEILLQTGLLTRYIPELEPIRCHTQFDTYHVYTVDIHLLLTLTEMKKIGRGRLSERGTAPLRPLGGGPGLPGPFPGRLAPRYRQGRR